LVSLDVEARSHRKARRRRWSFAAVSGGAFGFSALLGLNAGQNWRIRAIALLLFCVIFLAVFVPMIASRRFVFVTETSKLVTQHYSQRVRVTVEVLCRLTFLGLVLYMVSQLWEVCLDCADILKHGEPVQMRGTVTDFHYSGPTAWASKFVSLRSFDSDTTKYTMLFYRFYPKEGADYDAVVLPRSKYVLEMRRVQ
jgi:hypothetical protein